jgi:Flp pilus assembly protein TadG
MRLLQSRLTRRLIGEERGAALVEFAVSSLLFVTVAFGTMEFSRMIMDYNIVSNAAREGVRWAAVRGAASGRTATATSIKNYVVSRANGLLAPSNITVTWPVNNNVGSDVQVQVQYPFVPIAAMLPQATINLTSTTRMTIVR